METNTLIFDRNGLIPAVIQDSQDHRVLMVGYMNKLALQKTIDSKQVWFFSRSRQELWLKGETSGNYMDVVDIKPDCDSDSLLIKVNPHGPACHTGEDTCFFQESVSDDWSADTKTTDRLDLELSELANIIAQRNKELPDGSYTAELLRSGINKIGQKVIEEAGETALAAMAESDDNTKNEVADLLYHLLVLLEAKEISLKDIAEVLSSRRR
ncbi:MAG: bifunctional phosphoribosyl-AMP cyclohydrolase/phosphoribosyl-ATP diphosphatase HisIE [Chloroflexota bacterium]|nr:bifunctional phosphoribosyl-AMP cyclohydrolase/phosphoribosyl-ATP diphosphatase HisIE [Chloroflexota bacterium]